VNISISNIEEQSIKFLTNGNAVVTKKSPFLGIYHTATLVMTEDQYSNWLANGELIQNALPHLTADEREFLMTGITPQEWDAVSMILLLMHVLLALWLV
jgi:hypothetical protein